MKTVALILAGGVGSRMGADIPKQFLTVYDKPIIVYTLERFQSHPGIDSIGVVCVHGWEDVVRSYREDYGIDKLDWVITGGDSYLASIREGIYHLEGELAPEDVVVVHNSVQPILSAEIITDAVRVARRYGSGVSATPYNDQLYFVDDEDPTTTTSPIERSKLRRVTTPNAYQFGCIDETYRRIEREGTDISGVSGICVMMALTGTRLHFSAGSDRNIKITNKDDMVVFKAYLNDNELSPGRGETRE